MIDVISKEHRHWLDVVAEQENNELRSECLTNRVDWEKSSIVHGNWANWKSRVGSNVRGIWHTLSDDQKMAIAHDALEKAKDEYEDF